MVLPITLVSFINWFYYILDMTPKTQVTKGKLIKWGCQMKVLHSEGNNQQSKKETYGQEKLFANYITHKVLAYKIF